MTDIDSTVLSGIQTPKDLEKLGSEQLERLTKELREMLLSNVSSNGGHLASNLGVVELTIAVLRSFDFNKDKIVWDVGHQSYVYKILTGRRDRFHTIRKKDGLSGFPKRSESKYDFFNTGHSSTAVSAALGLARAAKINKSEEYAVAIVGDGALTGGMAFEALNDAGVSNENIIVILNDNEMSITKNVGGFAEYFSRMRSSRFYSEANSSLKKGVEKIPFIGRPLSKAIHRIKISLKYLLSQNMLFEEMGFQYLGPVDGHDIKKLEKIICDAKKIKGPVLIHTVTVKGKGYSMAEKEPAKYHGVGKFDTEDGFIKKEELTFSKVFGTAVKQIAVQDNKVCVVCPAVTLGCGLMELAEAIPKRFFDVGIAEQHAVTMAAGMACNGIIPVVAGYSTFMQRAYDQILHDVCLMNIHVVFAFDRAGIVSDDGETHQGIYDISYLSGMPNIKVYAPRSFKMLEKIVSHSIYGEKGPVVIRYPKGYIEIPETTADFQPKKIQTLKAGGDCVIFSYGKMLETAMEIAGKFEADGILTEVVDLVCLKPLDKKGIIKAATEKKFAICIEDVIESGCISSQIYKILKESENTIKTYIYNLGINPTTTGSFKDILLEAGITAEQIYEDIKKLKQNESK